MSKWLKYFALLPVVAAAGCAMATDIMDTGNGTYMISARAAPIRGGAAGAQNVAYQDANKRPGALGGGHQRRNRSVAGRGRHLARCGRPPVHHAAI